MSNSEGFRTKEISTSRDPSISPPPPPKLQYHCVQKVGYCFQFTSRSYSPITKGGRLAQIWLTAELVSLMMVKFLHFVLFWYKSKQDLKIVLVGHPASGCKLSAEFLFTLLFTLIGLLADSSSLIPGDDRGCSSFPPPADKRCGELLAAFNLRKKAHVNKFPTKLISEQNSPQIHLRVELEFVGLEIDGTESSDR